ncbi:2326_t:CDS:2 [Dentiscutata erythropus]|uniref:2326_t:CDS:1 n=1 Tax=Dentiscutata erythropus TaxID=1348616 RepID=A0A9N8VSM7_9GLOM|nr:2326_t:CDS:2 [Dentiscutata erythropus]
MASNLSIEFLANALMNSLDRGKIFPPQLNNPEELLSAHCNRISPPTRPPNGFLLCRKNVHFEAKQQGHCNMRVISKVTGILWRTASAEEKEIYEQLAQAVNMVYAQRYHPDSNSYYMRNMQNPYVPMCFPPPQLVDCSANVTTYPDSGVSMFVNMQPEYLPYGCEMSGNLGLISVYYAQPRTQ